MQPRIVVVSGNETGSVFPLSAGQHVIGRDELSDVPLTDESVGLRHCILTIDIQRCEIEDCGSINGTTLNGERTSGRQPLQHGDHVGLGDTEIAFLIETEDDLAESPVFLDDVPFPPAAQTVSAPRGRLLDTIVECCRMLRYYRRDASLTRAKMISFIFSICPAERVAIVLVDRDGGPFEITAQDRNNPSRPMHLNRSVVERVYEDGIAVVMPSAFYIPMQAFDGRIGVLVVEGSELHTPSAATHLEKLAGVAVVGASSLEHLAMVERLLSENSALRKEWESRHNLVGDSPAMAALGRLIAKTAPTDSTVLIQGESGTGKELVARAIHHRSKRASGPFVAINCGAISETLLESELFGHEKGAFTGAIAQKKGKFELASGGTLFLDEVGELPTAMQVKLLRVLQEREIERLGGTQPLKVNIRLVVATNRNLEKAVENGEFRQDLYFRLKVVTIPTPSLRERPDDIPLLARHFVSKYSPEFGRPIRGILPDTARILRKYDWPGNVRELENIIQLALVMGSTEMVLPEDLPSELFETQRAQPDADTLNYYETLNATKRDLLKKAFVKASGKPKKAAELLGLNLTHLYRLLKNLDMGHLLSDK